MFYYERERALERALRAMVRAAWKAVEAQERYDYWNQFGTGSTRARSADVKRDKALQALRDAEEQANEALNFS